MPIDNSHKAIALRCLNTPNRQIGDEMEAVVHALLAVTEAIQHGHWDADDLSRYTAKIEKPQ